MEVAEFFAGIGLMRMGLERAGAKVVYANDLSESKAAMYQGHFGTGAEFVRGDLWRIEPRSVPKVDLATASFPCTDLSLAGARKGLAGPQSSAFWAFIRILEGVKFRPDQILIENVPAFLTSGDGEDFHEAMLALSNLGYALDAWVLDAAYFVPQSRKRLFVAGRLGGIRGQVPESPSPLRPHGLLAAIERSREARWNMREIDPPKEDRPTLASVLEPGAPWLPEPRLESLKAQLGGDGVARAIDAARFESPFYATGFRRMRGGRPVIELRTDGLAGCLRTPKGGSARQFLFRFQGDRIDARLFTARECARLMGAGDYRFERSEQQALFGFGDAVCVPAVEWLAKHALGQPVSS